MMLKKIISLFLIFTLLLQVLPVKQVGYILFSNQINEELPHGMSVSKETSKPSLLAEDFFHSSDGCDFLSSFDRSDCFSFYASNIPNNHAIEVPTPPPNI